MHYKFMSITVNLLSPFAEHWKTMAMTRQATKIALNIMFMLWSLINHPPPQFMWNSALFGMKSCHYFIILAKAVEGFGAIQSFVIGHWLLLINQSNWFSTWNNTLSYP